MSPFLYRVRVQYSGRVKLTWLSYAGRAGRKEEIAGPLLLLGSSAAGYISASVLTIDGGHLIVRPPHCLSSTNTELTLSLSPFSQMSSAQD